MSHGACGGEMIILKFSLKIISKDYSKVQFSLTSIDDIGKKKEKEEAEEEKDEEEEKEEEKKTMKGCVTLC